MLFKMKKVITELCTDAVKITVSCEGMEDVNIVLPVAMVSPQISLQIAGMISSDPMLCRKKSDEPSR